MIEILILGIIVIYIISTIICLVIMLTDQDNPTMSNSDFVKGIINSFIPVLNTVTIIRNL